MKNLRGHNSSAFLLSLLNNHSNPSSSMLLKGCKGQNMSSQRKNSKKNIDQTGPNSKVLLSLPGNVLNPNSKIMKGIIKPWHKASSLTLKAFQKVNTAQSLQLSSNSYRCKLVSKAYPLFLHQNFKAFNGSVVAVQHEHGQGGELSRAVPAVAAVNQHRAPARWHLVCHLNGSCQHELARSNRHQTNNTAYFCSNDNTRLISLYLHSIWINTVSI